jgi:hypothetical protein
VVRNHFWTHNFYRIVKENRMNVKKKKKKNYRYPTSQIFFQFLVYKMILKTHYINRSVEHNLKWAAG